MPCDRAKLLDLFFYHSFMNLLTGSFLFLHDFFCYKANVQLDKG